MGHIEFAEERRFFDLILPVTQAEAKKRYLVAVAFGSAGFEMAGVVPPFGFEIRMGIMIGRKT